MVLLVAGRLHVVAYVSCYLGAVPAVDAVARERASAARWRRDVAAHFPGFSTPSLISLLRTPSEVVGVVYPLRMRNSTARRHTCV